ncbi:hypothetical protein OSB04_001449 [Centaurea solstitialis]|uniref:Polyprotein n=1 Tax=Centaurea solstitialis TaxID=347529 RepID=A0AA38TR02_9ASTR|nr:hypothetical protein OSB04_001449 [Centaurea solstitialis]
MAYLLLSSLYKAAFVSFDKHTENNQLSDLSFSLNTLLFSDLILCILDSFDGSNYTRWADKVMFMLMVLNLAYVMDVNLEPIPENPIPEAGKQPDQKKRLLQKEAENLACGHIKNALSDRLYDLYASITCPRELWKSLEHKYKAQEEGTNKYLVSKYLRFQMVDDKPILEQVHELQVLVNKMNTLSIPIPEIFQVGAIIDKLPSSWKDFSKRMMHKSEDYSLDDMLNISGLKKRRKSKNPVNVNSVQAGGKNKGKLNSGGPSKKWNLGPQKKAFKRQGQSSFQKKDFKRNGKCHVCGETGHYARECKQRKSGPSGGPSAATNAVGDIGALVANLTMDEINMMNVTPQAHLVNQDKDSWYLDTRATAHVCDDKSKFVNYQEIHGKQVSTANGGRADIAGSGTILLHFTSGRSLTLNSVLHVPTITKNLLSYSKLDSHGFAIRGSDGTIVFSKNDHYIGKASLSRGMYALSLQGSNPGSKRKAGGRVGENGSNLVILDAVYDSDSSSDSVFVCGSDDDLVFENDVIVGNINEVFFNYSVCSISLWHKRLAHTNIKNLEKMHNKGLIEINNKDFEKCETCINSKFTKKPFPSVKRNTSILELIHSDICELNGILTRGGKRYFITFCDDFSRFLYVYLLHSKDQAFEAFKIYKAEVENQNEKRIKILRSDRGGEYFNHEFDTFCEENGIKHERTSPFTPQQNGLAERKNRTLVEMVNCMLNQSGLPTNLWEEALLTACYIHNRITSRVIPTSPYELWKGRKPDLSYLTVWGCIAYYRTPDPKRSKLGARAIKSIFVGYAINSNGYRLLDKETGVIVESRDVDFLEDKFSEDAENSDRTLAPSFPGTSHDSSKTSQKVDEPRRSTRVRKGKSLGDDFLSYLVEGTRKKVTREVIFSINIDDDPKTFKEAMSSRDASLWKEAINDEMDSILSNGTWELTDLPKGAIPIGSKWIFKRKRHPDGTVLAFKARLVAKGYRQREGIDYFDTYAPVARISSIRTLIAISALKGLYIHQMDVKTAFLNGYLNEEIYMEQPEGFVMHGQENKVCRLVKSLYGLKQAPKQWHERFDTTVTSFGFIHNGADRCIYSKCTKESTVVICLYVDDMLIIGTSLVGILETKNYLSSNFKMKDLGEVDTILGIKVKRSESQISLSQTHYIEKILTKFQHLNIKEFNSPFDSSVKLEKNSGRVVAQLEYASAIGCMMYAMYCTRPDIAFAVSKLSQFTSNPGSDQWKAIGTLTYNTHPGILEGYSDASWIDNSSDSKSTSGWIFTLAGGAISWASKKQTCIAHSTMEAEFIALAVAYKEAEWIRDLLTDLHFWPRPTPSIPMYCDSEATLSRVYNSIYNGKSRHLGLRHNYVRQLIENGTISIVYVKSCGNSADPLTKPLTRDLIGSTTRDMGLKPRRISQ